ncbi:MAG TPA: HIT family protein [Acidimicrobiales bacterium]|nr:HIT family protein [Acidimicrobiales bacterium]
MATIFTRIIEGELPGTFVWRDDTCVAFMSINPLQPGHTLVVPVAEVDHWIDLDPATTAHLFDVSRRISRAIDRAFNPVKVGLMIAGLEVPHTHVHLVPIRGVHDLDFANAAKSVDPAELEAAAEHIRRALAELGETPEAGSAG